MREEPPRQFLLESEIVASSRMHVFRLCPVDLEEGGAILFHQGGLSQHSLSCGFWKNPHPAGAGRGGVVAVAVTTQQLPGLWDGRGRAGINHIANVTRVGDDELVARENDAVGVDQPTAVVASKLETKSACPSTLSAAWSMLVGKLFQMSTRWLPVSATNSCVPSEYGP